MLEGVACNGSHEGPKKLVKEWREGAVTRSQKHLDVGRKKLSTLTCRKLQRTNRITLERRKRPISISLNVSFNVLERFDNTE
jgi:hypothetical protein